LHDLTHAGVFFESQLGASETYWGESRNRINICEHVH